MGVMSLAEMMDRSIDILKKYFKTIILFNVGYGLLGLLIIVPAIFIGVIISLVIQSVTTAIILIGSLVLVIVGLFISSYIGIIKIASQEFIGEKVYAFEAIKYSFKKIFKAIGFTIASLLFYIPLIGTGVTFYYFVFLGLEDFFLLSESNAIGAIILLILFVLAGMGITSILMTYFSFVLQAIAIENVGIIKGIRRSIFLVKGSFWRIVGFNTLLYLTVMVFRISIQSLIGIFLGILLMLLNFLNISPELAPVFLSMSSLIQGPLNIISSILIAPMSMIALTVLYFNQRFKKEGLDLFIRVKELNLQEEGNKLE